LYERKCQTTRSEITSLAEGDHSICVTPQLLSFGVRRLDSFVLHQRQDEIAK
jgi:hypothetical protein